MIYVLVSIDFFPQLETVHPQLCDRIRRDLRKAGAECGLLERSARAGASLYGGGQKTGFDPHRVMDFCFRAAALLSGLHRDLVGYNLLLANREEAPPDDVRAALSHALLQVEGKERIWLEGGCRELFADLVEMTAQGDFWFLPRVELLPAAHRRPLRAVWLRERVAERVLDGLDLNLDRPRREGILMIVDPLEIDRKRMMEGLLERLGGSAGRQPIPRMATLFRRRSGLHPFLNSIEPALLEATPRYLKPVEKAVWGEVGDILAFVKRGGDAMCPDRLDTEFYLAYHLYLLAYLRSMEEKLLPGVFVAEDIDTYHPAALRSLYLLLQDLSLHPSFLPVLVSSRPELPAELQTLRVRRLFVRPMGRTEIQETAAAMYPGLEVPRAALRQVRRACGGQLVPLVHYLEYLRRVGKIAGAADRYSWVAKREKDIPFPANPHLAAWSLVESLPETDRQILHVVYLTAGLLDRGQLLGFLEALDVPAETAQKTLLALRELGLVHGDEYLIPIFPRLGHRLRARAEEKAGNREEGLLAYLWELWRTGGYTRPVLLFTYLLRHGRGSWALEILPRLLKRKLDEIDLAGAELFLGGNRTGFERQLDARGRRALALLIATSRLRASLLAGRPEEAERQAAELQKLLADDQPDDVRSRRQAEGCLQLAAHAEVTGDLPRALECGKRSLVAAQQLGLPYAEKQACRAIGSVQLAEGRLAEALEYFGFAEGFDRDCALEEIHTLGLQSIALFLQGNLSRAMRSVQRGAGLAAQARRREWEVLLRFLRGRILFEQGDYREALKEFQEDLTIASLYALGAASEMLYAWMARALGFAGETESAVRLLERLEDRPEKLYFLAESRYLLGDETAAAQALDRAQILESGAAAQASGGAERIDWRDGFAAVEGRCAALWTGRGLRGRLLSGFGALLRGAEGAEDLHAITRGEPRIPEADPHLHLYHYFYWKVLPQDRNPSMDDDTTVLNRALKNLQQRAARIEDSTQRYQYLHRSYWNARILKDATQRKLI